MVRPSQSRRSFFRKLAGEVASYEEETRGVVQYSLSELDRLPPERLAGLIFQVAEGWEVFNDGPKVCARSQGGELELFSAGSPAAVIFERIDGRASVREVAAAVAAALGCAEQAAFEQTRELLVGLARHAICVPINAPK